MTSPVSFLHRERKKWNYTTLLDIYPSVPRTRHTGCIAIERKLIYSYFVPFVVCPALHIPLNLRHPAIQHTSTIKTLLQKDSPYADGRVWVVWDYLGRFAQEGGVPDLYMTRSIHRFPSTFTDINTTTFPREPTTSLLATLHEIT